MEPDDTNGRVLVVEDEEDLRSLVELNLHLAGLDAVTASDGRVAPGPGHRPHAGRGPARRDDARDGRLAGAARADVRRPGPGHRGHRATALSEERDLIRGHLQGAVRYMTKPFEMRALADTVRDALQPPDEEELQVRRQRTRELLQRLAELDSGRSDQGPRVNFAGLERHRPSGDDGTTVAGPVDPRLLDELTEQQRHVAQQLADRAGARQIATELGVSRSNVYAVRKRIARRLGVDPDEVAEVTRRLSTS